MGSIHLRQRWVGCDRRLHDFAGGGAGAGHEAGSVAGQPLMTSPLAQVMHITCGSPVELHPYSLSVLQGLYQGTVTPVEFLMKFALTNSSYLDSMWCILYQFGHTTLI